MLFHLLSKALKLSQPHLGKLFTSIWIVARLHTPQRLRRAFALRGDLADHIPTSHLRFLRDANRPTPHLWIR